MKDKITIFVAILLLLLGLKVISNGVEERWEVIVGERSYVVEVRDSDAERSKGLSGHKPLLENEGMLFVFEKEGNYGFWMKDMLFPIDIIWIDKNFVVNHIESEVSPETYPKVFYPMGIIMYVLEVSSGQASSSNIKIGDAVKFVKK